MRKGRNKMKQKVRITRTGEEITEEYSEWKGSERYM